jgi:putative ABC transport system substrate-binding protein
MIERRAFLRAAGVAVLFGHVDAAAQSASGTHRIGFLGGGSASGYARFVEALLLGLRDHGYVPGKNVTIEYRWADGQYERLPALAAQLLGRKVDIIITQGTPAAHAAKRATSTIPIVMAIVGNPVESGIVASYARPGGNITGSSFFWDELNAKRLELMKTVMPDLVRPGVLLKADNPAMPSVLTAMEARAQALKMELEPVRVRRLDELEDAFQHMRRQIRGLVVVEDGLFLANVRVIADLAIKHRMPTCWPTEWIFRTSGGKRACSWTRSSRVASRRTCRSSKRRGSSCCSTSKPRRR